MTSILRTGILALVILELSVVNNLKAESFVFHISVDGLRPTAVTALGPTDAPNFYRFRNEGVFTDNARTDYDYTITLPNHTSQLTGRSVNDQFGVGSGHRYTDNGDPGVGVTIHNNAGYNVASVFDVAHDNGLSTGMYATKSKFSLYEASYSSKIDVVEISDLDSVALMATLSANMASPATRTNYTFLHFHDADTAGHSSTWDITEPPASSYLDAVRDVDDYLGLLFDMIENDPALAGNTTIILTADHGGRLGTTDHGTASSAQNYTIPFYVWGAHVGLGDLYIMNAGHRAEPGTSRPLYSAAVQPIRNGEAANLALDLLGLGAVPGSTINAHQTLVVPESSTFVLIAIGAATLAITGRKRLAGS